MAIHVISRSWTPGRGEGDALVAPLAVTILLLGVLDGCASDHQAAPPATPAQMSTLAPAPSATPAPAPTATPQPPPPPSPPSLFRSVVTIVLQYRQLEAEATKMYDLLLKGGTVIDPSHNLHERMDVGITGDRITGLAAAIDGSEATQVIDVSGKLVTPGLVDNHIHVYPSIAGSKHPDFAGVFCGVTTAADAGGAGPNNFQDFCNSVMTQSQTRLYCLLSIFRDRGSEAMKKRSDDSMDGWDIDIDGVVALAREYPDIVKGIKIQLSFRESHAIGLKHVEAAKVASREANIPVLMHLSDTAGRERGITSPQMVGQAVSLMDPGDAITHVFTPNSGSTLDEDGRILPEVLEAQQRGVLIDTANDGNNFGWAAAEMAMSQGLVPDMIASDNQITYKPTLLRSLLEYSSYYLHLGFSVDDVVRMMTITPARFLRIEDRAGTLALGRDADIAVLELLDGQWSLQDSNGVCQVGSQSLVPALTIKSGRVIESGAGLYPWGWAPPAVAEPEVAV